MKELNDDELQEDAKSYSTLFDLLKTEPEGGLPYDFSAKVVRSVEAQTAKKHELKYNLLAALIFVLVLVIAWYAVAIYNPKLSAGVSPYKWFLLAAPLVFVAIQYLDQQLVKRKLFRGL